VDALSFIYSAHPEAIGFNFLKKVGDVCHTFHPNRPNPFRTAYLEEYERAPWSDSCRSKIHGLIDRVGVMYDADQDHATVIGNSRRVVLLCGGMESPNGLAKSLLAGGFVISLIH
jgi:hypothetical protein